MPPFTITVVGKPNVGKSTIINRLLGSREAIVHNTPGLTRDRVNYPAKIGQRAATLIDTGGLPDLKDHLSTPVREQIGNAVHEAHIVMIVFDLKTGITPLDIELTDFLRKESGSAVLLPVINKADHNEGVEYLPDYYRLGLPTPVMIAAAHRRGFRHLETVLRETLDTLPVPDEAAAAATSDVRISIVGKPNAGKSSLFNRIIKQSRSIVDSVPGTTRDTVSEVITFNDQLLTFLDTAGLRRKNRVHEDIEFYSTVRSRQSISRTDVCILIIDATEQAAQQDKKIFEQIETAGKGVLLLINKWDLMKGASWREYISTLRHFFPLAHYAEILPVSSLTGYNIKKVLQKVLRIAENSRRHISTPKLNRWLTGLGTVPLVRKGRQVKIHYVTQAGIAPPDFIFFVNNVELIRPSTERYFAKQLRQSFAFDGCPLRLHFRNKRKG
jgi:GTPase